MTAPNGIVCFTNCLLPQEDGSLVARDLWIDEQRGVVLDSQHTFFRRKERPSRTIDLEGNILSPGFVDVQINGAYGFDFSVHDGDDSKYLDGMKTVAERIVETGVTSLVPTLITQDKAFYPRILGLLKPFSTPTSATLLGWHAEGPFIDYAKRGAHEPPFLKDAPEGFKSIEEVYGAENLADQEDWLMGAGVGVRIITAAPEVEGVMGAVKELSERGVIFSIGHSAATIEVATAAVRCGARLITHLFNAMPQLHHRDPSIIGLLGASPSLATPDFPSIGTPLPGVKLAAEAFTPLLRSPPPGAASPGVSSPTTPALPGAPSPLRTPPAMKKTRDELHLDKGEIADMDFERPYYGLIVDGIHSHPNSVRLAYSAHPEGCVLVTDAMKILDPNLPDGLHPWRDGKNFLKEGEKLYLEGTTTLAGSFITLDKCIRNFSRFTGCSLGEALKCATFNPAMCLGIENSKGTLRAGADADLVVLDRKGHVLGTWVGGKEVWTRTK